MVAISLLQQCRISPLPATVPRPPLPLTFFDIPWLNLNSVDRLFFYHFPYSTAVFLESHLPNLKSSLSLTLSTFYPLAGAIRRSSPDDDRFELCYCEGDSVSLTVCECESIDFGEISGYHRRQFGKLLLLVPSLHKSASAQPVFAVQVTLFPNKGLCLAVKIHHAACDGFSSIHFLKSWAAAANLSTPPPPPSLHRSSITDPHSLYSKLARTVLLQRSLPHNPHSPTPSPTLTAATFTISSHQIQNLKLKLRSKAADQQLQSPFHISTFVISLAYSWTCLLKCREKEDNLNSVAHLFFSVDWRNRMRPPPPANYFGNCLGCPCFVKARVGDIVEEKDGFFKACEAIGKAIEEIGDNVYEGMECLFEKLMKVLPHRPLSIAGSPKLKVYECDFGWGKPEKVDVTSIGETGALSMAESRDDEGGVEIGVVLPEDEIVVFGMQFNRFQSKCEENIMSC